MLKDSTRHKRLWSLFDLVLRVLKRELQREKPKGIFVDITVRFLAHNGINMKDYSSVEELEKSLDELLVDAEDFPYDEEGNKKPVVPVIPFDSKKLNT